MKLIVGLGNPGLEYQNTRHNMGFRLVDMLSNDVGPLTFKKDFKGEYAKGEIEGQSFYILKPLTFMNLSGQSVQPFCSYFRIPYEDIIVISDDMALKPGMFRLREGGSSGGQKGLQNIIDLTGTDQIKRIRIGTGEPENRNVVDYVLGVPSKEDQSRINQALDQALLALKYAIAIDDFSKAMNKFNTKKAFEA